MQMKTIENELDTCSEPCIKLCYFRGPVIRPLQCSPGEACAGALAPGAQAGRGRGGLAGLRDLPHPEDQDLGKRRIALRWLKFTEVHNMVFKHS